MMRHYRAREYEGGHAPAAARVGLPLWRRFATRPWLYRLATRVAIGLIGRVGRKRGRLARLPLAEGWTRHRDFPAPEGRTFQDQWDAAGGAR